MTDYKDTEYKKKHPADRRPPDKILEAVRQRAKENEMPCAVAFDIARDLNVQPSEVGFALDYSEIRLVKCQLGLFGYKPQKSIVSPSSSVSQDLEKDIKVRLKNGRLPCKEAWALASERGLRKMEVSSACEALGIKISECQLGAF